MKDKGKYYITTAIAYTSATPHIGNSYEIVLADSVARYKRRDGYDVYFQTGTDEHGQKIELKAEAAGVSPQAFVDDIAGQIQTICDDLNVSYDHFIRTTDPEHERRVQKIFKKLYDQGDIYKGSYEGLYCTPCESFWTQSQLVDGKCPDCGREVKPAKEEAYFFRMSKYADRLIAHINAHPEFIQPVSRKNEMMNNFLLPGLQDLCVSRTSFSWGIPVDFDDKHVVYVWLDALANYITGIGYEADGESSDLYKKLWPADLHLIGKDILRFHTIYWPIFLMALGEPLPKQVFGHPWLLNGGKMSKTTGNVIYAEDLIRIFGVDAVRYYVLHEMPYENDGVISWELMVERTNSDLANTLGNLVNRTVSMSNKYFDGLAENRRPAVISPEDAVADSELAEMETFAYGRVATAMEQLRVADALTEIFALFKRCNKYIDETEPWVLAKDADKQERLSQVLYNLLNGILIGASLLEPFMPDTAQNIAGQIGADLADYAILEECASMQDTNRASALYPSGSRVTQKPQILFARRELPDVLEQAGVSLDAEPETAAQTAPAAGIDLPPKAQISYEDFDKCQFQVGKIISCEAVPKSKKLLCSKVQVGSRTKQIISGIHASYTPEEMVGKEVMVLVNLQPKEIAGLMSEGMLLCAEDASGKLSLMKPDTNMPAGAEIC